MKLYYYPGAAASRRVLATAFQLQLPMELNELPHGDDAHANTRRARQLCTSGRAPVLEDGTFSLWESNAIMQYLCTRKIGQLLFPEEEKPRLDIARWQFWQTAHFEAACEKGQTDSFRTEARVIETHLKARRYLVGDAVTLADFSVGSCLQFWQIDGLPLEEFRNLRDWYAHLESLESWKKGAPRAR